MGCQDTFLTVHFIVVITNVTFLLTHCIATVLLSLIPVLDGKNYINVQIPDTITITAIT